MKKNLLSLRISEETMVELTSQSVKISNIGVGGGELTKCSSLIARFWKEVV